LAAKQFGLAAKVDGLVRRSASIAECESLGVVDHATREPEPAAEDADLVVLCTPISQMRQTLERMRPALKRGVIVTDVGSVKDPVVTELERLVTGVGGYFVGSHPMAGAEKQGPQAAHADLFRDAVCVITPTDHSAEAAVAKVEAFWCTVGARTLRMSPSDHDDLVSRSSHLPHIVAAGLANYILSPAHPPAQAGLCATGFRDVTRIASGSPGMWRDIVLANRANLARVLRVFTADLDEFRHALEKADADGIEEFFEQAKKRRDEWANGNAAPSAE